MPNCRRRRLCCRVCCVACQAERRASSGCVDEEEEICGCRDARRVSCRPGAEGAPAMLEEGVLEAPVLEVAVVLEVLVAWEGRGAMRRDCVGC
jgi:hypothetical protein